jgi:hypothetical protein
MGNTWVGSIFQQYRVFMFSKLNNFYQKTKYSRDGVGYEAVQLDNGEWITKKEMIMIEGALQSFVHGFNQLVRFKSLGYKNMMDFFRSAPEVRKMNITNSILKVGTFLLLYYLWKGFDDDDDEKGVDLNMTWLASDLMISTNMSDVIKDPIPLVGQLSSLAYLLIGEGDMSMLINRFGPLSTAEEIRQMTLTDEEKKAELGQKLKEKREEKKRKKQEENED